MTLNSYSYYILHQKILYRQVHIHDLVHSCVLVFDCSIQLPYYSLRLLCDHYMLHVTHIRLCFSALLVTSGSAALVSEALASESLQVAADRRLGVGVLAPGGTVQSVGGWKAVPACVQTRLLPVWCLRLCTGWGRNAYVHPNGLYIRLTTRYIAIQLVGNHRRLDIYPSEDFYIQLHVA